MELTGTQPPSSPLDLTLAHWGDDRMIAHNNGVNVKKKKKKGQMGYSGQNSLYKNTKFPAVAAPGMEVTAWLLVSGQYSPAGSWCLDAVFLLFLSLDG